MWRPTRWSGGRGRSARRLNSDDAEIEVGLDAKWIPNPNLVIDATVNPDFSQIEADAPQIADNERFALFFAEKRPFFLENVDLFSTPLQAIYTRTFTSPRFGLRASGDIRGTQFTVLAGEDRGGGSVILPGPENSDFADQDYESQVVLGRVKHNFGKAFASFLFSGREIDGGAYNRVFGPDFEWRPSDAAVLKAQVLFSSSQTPERPELAAEWDGRKLDGSAARVSFDYNKKGWDLATSTEHISPEFRADNGFLPTVGYRNVFAEGGYTFYPVKKKITRLRLFTFGEYNENWDGGLLRQEVVPGFGLDAPLNSFVRTEFAFTRLVNAGREFELFEIRPEVEIKPGRILSLIYLDAAFGDTVDFAHNRPGRRDHRAAADQPASDRRHRDRSRRHPPHGGRGGRAGPRTPAAARRDRPAAGGLYLQRAVLAAADRRARGYRARSRALYAAPVDDRTGGLSGSLVFAYKLNWQTVLFLGLGDNRELDQLDELQPNSRQAFFKISYAFQR